MGQLVFVSYSSNKAASGEGTSNGAREFSKTKMENNHRNAHFNSSTPYRLALLKPLNVASGSHQGGRHGYQIKDKDRLVPDKSLLEVEHLFRVDELAKMEMMTFGLPR